MTGGGSLDHFPGVSQDFLIRAAASAIAIALMVALAAWARAGRRTDPLDAERARALLAEEFPSAALDALWLTSDRTDALARAGDRALVLARHGDGYVARDLPWGRVASLRPEHGELRLRLTDPGAPVLRLAVGAWPPRGLAA